MRGRTVPGTLSGGLPVPRLRVRKVLPPAHAQGLAVHPLQAPGVAHRGHFVRQHQAAVTYLVPRHVPRHAVQKRHLGDGSEASARSELQHGLDGQATSGCRPCGSGTTASGCKTRWSWTTPTWNLQRQSCQTAHSGFHVPDALEVMQDPCYCRPGRDNCPCNLCLFKLNALPYAFMRCIYDTVVFACSATDTYQANRPAILSFSDFQEFACYCWWKAS